MKFVLALTALFTTSLLLTAADVTYVPHDKIAGVLAKGGTVVTQPDLLVQGSHRDKAGQVEVHDKETDVIYMVDGEATFVTGGTMVDGKSSRPGQWLGKDIQGGTTHHLTKGDVMWVPAGVPHWFPEIPAPLSYLLVKVLQ